VLDQLENVWLKDTPYIAGQNISVADVLAACELEQPTMVEYDVTEGRPRLAAWWTQVRAQCQPHYDDVHSVIHNMRKRVYGDPQAKL